MKLNKTWLILILIALTALWGCSDDDDPVAPEYVTFSEMADFAAAYINSSDCPGVVAAATVAASLEDYTIIDIRLPGAFATSHIEGAYNSSLATLLDDLAVIPHEEGDTYLVVCYSGQSAGHAKIAMELAGYTPVMSLKYGMCGWNSSLSTSWMDATIDDANGGDNLLNASTVNENANLETHDFPAMPIEATSTTGIVEWMLDEGFKGITWDTVSANLDDYFIINYFTEDQYMGAGVYAHLPGHIEGAFQFTPAASLGLDQMLENIPTDMTVVVYCWTSQTSSQVTAYLNMLGYDAYSLKFGVNHLFYSDLPDGFGGKWVELTTDYPLVVPEG